jgi:LPS sulfotransferase NodH
MQLRDWTVRFSDSKAVSAGIAAMPGRLLPLWERTRGTRTRRAHIERIVRHRTGANGVFGLKLQPDQLHRWFGDLASLQAILGPSRLVRLHRSDRDAQVSSFVHAVRTGQWSANDPPSRVRVPVSRRWAQRQIDRQERQLDQITSGQTVYSLTTEALLSDFDGSLRSVLQFLGEPIAGPLPGPSHTRQLRK